MLLLPISCTCTSSESLMCYEKRKLLWSSLQCSEKSASFTQRKSKKNLHKISMLLASRNNMIRVSFQEISAHAIRWVITLSSKRRANSMTLQTSSSRNCLPATPERPFYARNSIKKPSSSLNTNGIPSSRKSLAEIDRPHGTHTRTHRIPLHSPINSLSQSISFS